MTKKKYIHLGIMLLITLLISICPTIGSLTPLGMRTLAIFIAVLYGWMTVDLIWQAFMDLSCWRCWVLWTRLRR